MALGLTKIIRSTFRKLKVDNTRKMSLSYKLNLKYYFYSEIKMHFYLRIKVLIFYISYLIKCKELFRFSYNEESNNIIY